VEQLCGNELMQRVRQQLGNENATPLILSSVYGWEHQEIAAWLGIHEEASKKRAQRAVARLRTLAETDETFKALLEDE
jgi:DNA-directed RNA polymerase specialized sigma24 family protein